jgi:hypothetical protein
VWYAGRAPSTFPIIHTFVKQFQHCNRSTCAVGEQQKAQMDRVASRPLNWVRLRQSIFVEDATPANKASAVMAASLLSLDLLCVGLARRAGESFH